IVKRCGSPVASACARVNRNCAATSFAAERRRMPSVPPPIATAASRLASATIASTRTTSSKVNPDAVRRIVAATPSLFELHVRIHAFAAGLPVLAQADEVEGLAFAWHAVDVRMVPGILELAGLRIGTEPAGGVGGVVHQCL